MTAQAGRHGLAATGSRRKLGRRLGLCGLLVLLVLAALLLGRWRADNASEAILAQQRDMQQAWLDTSLTAISAWRNELAGQARFIADSELFRLPGRDERAPDDAGPANMAGQRPSMEDLLRELTKRRGWVAARILAPDATPLAAPDSPTPLGTGEAGLVRLAGKSGQAALGPLRMTDKGLVMDLAEPLPAVGGNGQPQAVLLLTVPMDKPLAGFLGLGGGGKLLARIVDQGPDGPVMLLLKGGQVVREPVTTTLVHELEPAAIPFMRREALDGRGEVYSLGAQAAVPDWRMVLETPAPAVEGVIGSEAFQNYLLFLACAAALWLSIVLISMRAASRTFEARNRVLVEKNATISRQKALLDSVNASLHAGLVLVDSQGRVQMENRAFTALAGRNAPIPPGTPLVEVLPGKVAVQLLGDMAVVHDCGKSATVEVTLPPLPDAPADDDEGDGSRLFRVALHPYGADASGGEPGTTGCVASFQDITRFRRNTERGRQRQLALITALVRAIESVDPCQAGHSDRMARTAGLVAEELDLDLRERETLGLAARLSQIGKIFVPREILTKRGALTPEERKEALRAPEHADRILHDLHFDLPVRETVREMGERMDGSGSPQGLTGEEISRAGRVLAVVNAFVAMTSPRPWRDDKGMDTAEALSLLAQDLRFDQEVVTALARVVDAQPEGAATGGDAQP